jgi:uncharacterized protein (DUF2384 family)
MLGIDIYEGFSALLKACGITNDPVGNDWELLELCQKRLPKTTLPIVAQQLGLGIDVVLKAIDLDEQHYNEMEKNDLFSMRHTEHLLKMMQLVCKGKGLWGGRQDGFKHWMQAHIPALNGQQPTGFLGTFVGIELLIAILGRVEHGVYS